jgi:antitoxin MazE
MYVDTEVWVMKIAKWGNSLAIRVPSEVAQKLNLKSGDEIQIAVTGEHKFEVSRDRRRLKALEKLRKLRFELPADYKFNRDELYDRHEG